MYTMDHPGITVSNFIRNAIIPKRFKIDPPICDSPIISRPFSYEWCL